MRIVAICLTNITKHNETTNTISVFSPPPRNFASCCKSLRNLQNKYESLQTNDNYCEVLRHFTKFTKICEIYKILRNLLKHEAARSPEDVSAGPGDLQNRSKLANVCETCEHFGNPTDLLRDFADCLRDFAECCGFLFWILCFCGILRCFSKTCEVLKNNLPNSRTVNDICIFLMKFCKLRERLMKLTKF